MCKIFKKDGFMLKLNITCRQKSTANSQEEYDHVQRLIEAVDAEQQNCDFSNCLFDAIASWLNQFKLRHTTHT